MTVVNKVRAQGFFFFSFLDTSLLPRWREDADAESGAVCRLGTQFFHELPTLVHPVHRLRHVRLGSKKPWDHLVPQFWYVRRQGVVSDQFFVGHRHLFGFEESGKFWPNTCSPCRWAATSWLIFQRSNS
jgi:hypothetical protein